MKTLKKKNVLDRIRPIGAEFSEGMRILIYGYTASGKTTLWSTFPDPILCMVCSGGRKPGELISINTVENRERISAVTLNSANDLSEVLDGTRGKYKTYVLDHISGYQDLALMEILGLEEIPQQKSWRTAQQEEWQELGSKVKRYLLDLLNTEGNIVIVGQAKEEKNERKST